MDGWMDGWMDGSADQENNFTQTEVTQLALSECKCYGLKLISHLAFQYEEPKHGSTKQQRLKQWHRKHQQRRGRAVAENAFLNTRISWMVEKGRRERVGRREGRRQRKREVGGRNHF